MKFITLLIGVFFVNSLKSQIGDGNIFIGQKEAQVTKYLDSLNKLKSNPYYKIDRTVTKNGDLQLSSEFSLVDEEFYKCLSIIFTFQRIKGDEVCIQQLIIGYAKDASSNLNFVKDKFKYVSPGKWETPFFDLPDYKIQAEFETDESKPENYYYLHFFIKKADPK
jgi:hypothetical protein